MSLLIIQLKVVSFLFFLLKEFSESFVRVSILMVQLRVTGTISGLFSFASERIHHIRIRVIVDTSELCLNTLLFLV